MEQIYVSVFEGGGAKIHLQGLTSLCRFCGNKISTHSKYKYTINTESHKCSKWKESGVS